ncbi:MAG: hypothetical protein Q9210_004650 [Variospora velana]
MYSSASDAKALAACLPERFIAPQDDADCDEWFAAAAHGCQISRLEAALKSHINLNALQATLLQDQAALYIVAENRHIGPLRILLAYEADVNLRNSYDEPALNSAAFAAYAEAVETLFDARAQINLQSGDEKETALYDVFKYKEKVIRQMIKTLEVTTRSRL